jgi:hypothetical protein
MKTFLEPHVIISLAVMVSAISIVAITLLIVLRDKISGVHVSRAGVDIHTNDVSVWSEVVDRIERIDASTCKVIRKATTRLTILDPEKHAMSPETMLVIREANLPLIYAAYENHHTREIESDADTYIADKAQDISEAINIWRKQFPELTDERCHAFACHWLKKILLPNLRKACGEKTAYYTSQFEQTDVSNTVKTILTSCRNKNLAYIQCIDRLAMSPDITEPSSLFIRYRPEPTR